MPRPSNTFIRKNNTIENKELDSGKGTEVFNNCKVKIFNNAVYTSKGNNLHIERKITTPAVPEQHWTNFKYHPNWIKLWHINQIIHELEYQFCETVNFDVFPQIEHYELARRKLLIDSEDVIAKDCRDLATLYCIKDKPGYLRILPEAWGHKTYFQHLPQRSEPCIPKSNLPSFVPPPEPVNTEIDPSAGVRDSPENY